MKFQSGHEVVSLEGTEKEKQNKDWKGYEEGLVRLTPGRWLFHANYTMFADKLYNFKFKSTDVVVMTWPKCGTTWMQEIIWTMRNNPELCHPLANQHVALRAPFLDLDIIFPRPKPGIPLPKHPIFDAIFKMYPDKNLPEGVNLKLTEFLPDPRTIKTHLPFSLLAPSLLDTSKVVYVARNPKDVIVSYHHHCRLIKMHDFCGSFEDFVQYFVDDDLMYGPYWLHLKEAWEKRDHSNLHFIFYEDLKANTMEELRKLNTFLNTNLTENQLQNIAKYTSFSEMKKRADAGSKNNIDIAEFFNIDIARKDGGFYRKGECGDWKGKFSPNLEAKVDQWTQKNMSDLGINFKYVH